MLPIAILGLPSSTLRGITARLRGVLLVSESDAHCRMIFHFGESLDVSIVERHLQDGKEVAITAGAGLTQDLFQHARLRVVNPDRYLPSRQVIRQQLDAGKLGEPGLLRLHCWEPPGNDRDAALLRGLDLALWYFGNAPNLVYAVASAGLHVHLGFENGGMALLDIVHDLPAPYGYHSLSIIGSCGAAYADDQPNMQILYGSNSVRAAQTSEGVLALTALVQDLVNTFATRGNASTWHDVLNVADAVRQSAASKQAIAPKGDA
jgi:predicted dehydrogenase